MIWFCFNFTRRSWRGRRLYTFLVFHVCFRVDLVATLQIFATWNWLIGQIKSDLCVWLGGFDYLLDHSWFLSFQRCNLFIQIIDVLVMMMNLLLVLVQLSAEFLDRSKQLFRRLFTLFNSFRTLFHLFLDCGYTFCVVINLFVDSFFIFASNIFRWSSIVSLNFWSLSGIMTSCNWSNFSRSICIFSFSAPSYSSSWSSSVFSSEFGLSSTEHGPDI